MSTQGKLALLKADPGVPEQREPPKVIECSPGQEEGAMDPLENFCRLGNPVPQFLQTCYRRGQASVLGSCAVFSEELRGWVMNGRVGSRMSRRVPPLHSSL